MTWGSTSPRVGGPSTVKSNPKTVTSSSCPSASAGSGRMRSIGGGRCARRLSSSSRPICSARTRRSPGCSGWSETAGGSPGGALSARSTRRSRRRWIDSTNSSSATTRWRRWPSVSSLRTSSCRRAPAWPRRLPRADHRSVPRCTAASTGNVMRRSVNDASSCVAELSESVAAPTSRIRSVAASGTSGSRSSRCSSFATADSAGVVANTRPRSRRLTIAGSIRRPSLLTGSAMTNACSEASWAASWTGRSSAIPARTASAKKPRSRLVPIASATPGGTCSASSQTRSTGPPSGSPTIRRGRRSNATRVAVSSARGTWSTSQTTTSQSCCSSARRRSRSAMGWKVRLGRSGCSSAGSSSAEYLPHATTCSGSARCGRRAHRAPRRVTTRNGGRDHPRSPRPSRSSHAGLVGDGRATKTGSVAPGRPARARMASCSSSARSCSSETVRALDPGVVTRRRRPPVR